MVNTKLLSKSMLVLLTIIIGASFGLYLWNPNTKPVIADSSNVPPPDTKNNGTPNITTQTTTPTFVEQNSGEENKEDLEIKPVINLGVEKYRSTSTEGPWVEADTPAGSKLTKGEWVYWKVIVENTGEVELEIEYLDLMDGMEQDIELLIGYKLPSSIDVGETIEFSYKSHIYSGVHWNEIQVTGKYNTEEIRVSDRAYYHGINAQTFATQNDESSNDQEPPNFVIPEYPLGVLGSLLSLFTAYLLTQIKRR